MCGVGGGEASVSLIKVHVTVSLRLFPAQCLPKGGGTPMPVNPCHGQRDPAGVHWCAAEKATEAPDSLCLPAQSPLIVPSPGWRSLAEVLLGNLKICADWLLLPQNRLESHCLNQKLQQTTCCHPTSYSQQHLFNPLSNLAHRLIFCFPQKMIFPPTLISRI